MHAIYSLKESYCGINLSNKKNKLYNKDQKIDWNEEEDEELANLNINITSDNYEDESNQKDDDGLQTAVNSFLNNDYASDMLIQQESSQANTPNNIFHFTPN